MSIERWHVHRPCLAQGRFCISPMNFLGHWALARPFGVASSLERSCLRQTWLAPKRRLTLTPHSSGRWFGAGL